MVERRSRSLGALKQRCSEKRVGCGEDTAAECAAVASAAIVVDADQMLRKKNNARLTVSEYLTPAGHGGGS